MSNTDVNPYFTLDGIDQSRRFRAYVKVLVNGFDVTNRLDPYLVSVLVKDSASWEAHVELDDRDGRLDIPPFNSPLEIDLGWTSETSIRVFTGTIADIEHGFGRKLGGRRMFIHAYGWQQSSMAKSPMQDHVGDGAPPGQMQGTSIPFQQAASQFAGNAGLSVDIGPTFQGTVRDYWSMNNESAMQFFQRFAEDFGAFTRIEGNNVVFNAMNDFTKPNVKAVWGDNLISWRIRPFAARSMWGGSSQQHFDHMLGQWMKTANSFGLSAPFGGFVDAVHSLPAPAPNSQVAAQTVAGDEEKTNMYTGEGRITINGEPQAAWGGTVTIIGARPGVDGTYFIMSADHSWSRQGYVTTLEVIPKIGDETLQEAYANISTTLPKPA
jgi:Bacteriophage probable baseplate hub protein